MRDEWRCSHIRTFRAGLFLAIADQDPELSCFKDDEGQWLMAAADAAMMFPILEMAGFNKVHFNHKILYTYNTLNVQSHSKQDPEMQEQCFEMVRSKRPFARVEIYLPELTRKHKLKMSGTEV